MLLIYFLFIAINFFLFCVNKKSRFVIVLTYLFIIIMMAGNAAGPDLQGYILEYKYSSDQRLLSDVGYNVLQDICGQALGLSFVMFRVLMTAGSLALINKTLDYFMTNKHLVVASYLSYLLFIDTCQIRNFIAQAIFIYSIIYLVQDGRKNVIKYSVLIIIASTIQITFVFYLILLVFKLKNKKLINRMLIALGIIMFLVSYLTRQNIYGWLLRFLLGDRGAGYFNSRTGLSWMGLVVLFLVGVIILFLLRYCYKRLPINSLQSKYIDYIWKTSGALVVTIPLLLSNYSFYRFIRNSLILFYIAYEVLLQQYHVRKAKRLGMILLIILFNMGWFIMDYVIANGVDFVVLPVLENNYFWGVDRISDIKELLLY